MNLIKFNPAKNPFNSNVLDLFDSIFDERPILNKYLKTPSVNIIKNENEYNIELSVPGIDKNDIKIEINEGVLTISSEQKDDKEEVNKNYKIKEFSYSSFSRSFHIPENVNSDKIQAKYIDGILNITLPINIKTEKKAKQIEIS